MTRSLFGELLFDPEENWVTTERGGMEIGLAEGEPSEDGVAHVEVDDLKAEAERLRAAGVDVGIVVELGGEMRLLDVFDPDGNRLQFAQELRRHRDPPDRPPGHAFPPRHARATRTTGASPRIPTARSSATSRTGDGAATPA